MARSCIVPLLLPAVFARFLVQTAPQGEGSTHLIARKGGKDNGAIVTIADGKKEATEACLYVCDRYSGDGGVSSQCITGCETEAHACLDSKTPHMEVRDRIAACKESVLPKYKEQGATPNCCNLIAQRGQNATHGATVTITEAKEEATEADRKSVV